MKEILKNGIKIQKEPLQSKKPPEFCIIDRELHMTIVNSLLNGSISKMYSQIYPLVSISHQLDPLYERSMSGKEGDGENLIVTLYPVIK